MARIYLGLGSNIERERYIVAGLDALQALLGDMQLSSVYESESIGFEGQPFLNMVVQATTELELGDLAARLRHIETQYGRPVNAQRFSSRQLDIDILTYDDLSGMVAGVELPRGEILDNAFVLQPLAELAPEQRHPTAGVTYRELWQSYDKSTQQLHRVAFSWQGREISQGSTS